MATKRSGLGSTATYHKGRAEAALAQSERFQRAAAQSFSKGSCEGALHSSMTARHYAELAVHEAHHARTKKSGGPTPLQSKVSKNADETIHLWSRVITKCSR